MQDHEGTESERRAVRPSGRRGRDKRTPENGADKSTRDRILDIALDLFVEEGYDKASLREIAERMGFTKAALYYHFPSKADMLMALHQRLHSLIDEPITLLGDGTVTMEAWEKFLDACVDKLQDNQKLFLVHRNNQAAFSKIHIEGHEGAHLDLEARARKLFSEPSLSPADRLRMAAAFAVTFITPMMMGDVIDTGTAPQMSSILRDVVRGILTNSSPVRSARLQAAKLVGPKAGSRPSRAAAGQVPKRRRQV